MCQRCAKKLSKFRLIPGREWYVKTKKYGRFRPNKIEDCGVMIKEGFADAKLEWGSSSLKGLGGQSSSYFKILKENGSFYILVSLIVLTYVLLN